LAALNPAHAVWTLKMVMLTYNLEPRFHRSEAQRPTGDAAKARLAMIKRVCLCALTVLLASGGIAAVIALKTPVYFWRFKLGTG
jgi:hypothetical protein